MTRGGLSARRGSRRSAWTAHGTEARAPMTIQRPSHTESPRRLLGRRGRGQSGGRRRHRPHGEGHQLPPGQGRPAAGAYSIQSARQGRPERRRQRDRSWPARREAPQPVEFSRWFAQRCFDEEPAYRDVREIIFWSTVRKRVIGWSDRAPGVDQRLRRPDPQDSHPHQLLSGQRVPRQAADVQALFRSDRRSRGGLPGAEGAIGSPSLWAADH